MPFYACTVGIKDGIARCRNEYGKCSVHTNPRLWTTAPRPDAVLFKVNLNEKCMSALKIAGIRINERTFERAQDLELDRISRAEKLGRGAYSVRPEERREIGIPEIADTGCPVFGPNGLANSQVTVRGVVLELLDDFVISDISMLQRRHKPPVRMVVEFSRKGVKPMVLHFPWITFWSLLQTTFDQVDVWANEKDPKGKVVHTLNCGKRNDAGIPNYQLRFSEGDWGFRNILLCKRRAQTETAAV